MSFLRPQVSHNVIEAEALWASCGGTLVWVWPWVWLVLAATCSWSTYSGFFLFVFVFLLALYTCLRTLPTLKLTCESSLLLPCLYIYITSKYLHLLHSVAWCTM